MDVRCVDQQNKDAVISVTQDIPTNFQLALWSERKRMLFKSAEKSGWIWQRIHRILGKGSIQMKKHSDEKVGRNIALKAVDSSRNGSIKRNSICILRS